MKYQSLKTYLLFISVMIFSCTISKEENYSKQFEDYYKDNMHDPSTFELIGVHIIEGQRLHKENLEFYKEKYLEFENGNLNQKEFDSIMDLRTSFQNVVLFKIRGKNKFGAKILKDVSTYFVDGKLKYLDGEIVY